MNVRRQTPTLSKDFKKKESFGGGLTQALDTSKLSELKSKLEKDREVVKTATGRRFKDTDARSSNTSFTRKQQQQTKTILSNEKSMRATPKQSSMEKKKNVPPVPPSRVSLSDLSTPNTETASMTSSMAFFDKEKDIQKGRNQEVYDFLKSIGLNQFYDAFIQEGFDEIDTIMEIETEVLNGMRMKASQQKRLFEAIKKNKGEVAVGTEPELKLPMSFSSINSRNRIRTEPVIEKPKSPVRSQSPSRQYKPASKIQSASLISTRSASFLYSVGNTHWTLQPANEVPVIRDRKACCHCFKITYQPIKNGHYYYCSGECIEADTKQTKRTSLNKSKISLTPSEDVKSRQAKTEIPVIKTEQFQDLDFMDLSMTTSMIRDYHN